jgi:hypothetical protein
MRARSGVAVLAAALAAAGAVAASTATGATAASTSVKGGIGLGLIPGNLLVSGTTYVSDPNLVAGQTVLPPGCMSACATAVASGTSYPQVFNTTRWTAASASPRRSSSTRFAVTSTVSGSGDQGADPNKVVTVTDQPAASSLPTGESFQPIEAATNGEVLRGVSFTPGTR